MNQETNPAIIIVGGPTGSGKGSLPYKIIDDFNIPNAGNSDNKYAYLGKNVIDDLVENNPNYKRDVDGIISNFCPIDSNTFECTDFSWLDNNYSRRQDVIKEFNVAYGKGRFVNNCDGSTNSASREAEQYYNEETNEGTDYPKVWEIKDDLKTINKLSCENINDENTKDAFREGRSFLFEFTGGYFPNWIWSPKKWNAEQLSNIQYYNYDVIMAWTLTDICELLKRNNSRAVESMREYIENKQNEGAPRLPDIRDKQYIEGVQKMANQLFKIISMTEGHMVNDRPIRFLIVDNTYRPSKYIYDSYGEKASTTRRAIFKIVLDLLSLNVNETSNSGKNIVSNALGTDGSDIGVEDWSIYDTVNCSAPSYGR